ncbi:MAG: hypothetical protein ACRCVT_16260 [Leadbetterella sp.]
MSEKLKNNLQNGFEVKISDYLSRGWEMFKDNMGGYIGYTILFFFIALICGLIPFVNIVSGIIITPCLIFGFDLVLNETSVKKTPPPFGTFFNGFSYLGKIVVIALIKSLIVLICIIPLGISIGFSILNNFNDARAMVTSILGASIPLLLISSIVILYISICWTFAQQIAVFNNKEAWESMETSRKLVNKNWFGVFLLTIVLGAINFAGLLFIGLGLIFTVPFSKCVIYAAYEDIAEPDNLNTIASENKEILDIGNGLKYS